MAANAAFLLLRLFRRLCDYATAPSSATATIHTAMKAAANASLTLAMLSLSTWRSVPGETTPCNRPTGLFPRDSTHIALTSGVVRLAQ
jgi:hypothetical protein